jgi:hypothetical protein
MPKWVQFTSALDNAPIYLELEKAVSIKTGRNENTSIGFSNGEGIYQVSVKEPLDQVVRAVKE